MASPTTHFRTFSTHPTCRLILDSCSDATCELAERMGVDIISFPFIMADGDHWDDQWESISSSEFYGRMRAGERVQTSAITLGTYLDVFEQCAADGIPTLYLCFTAGLSSSVHDAEAAAEQIREAHPDFDLVVIDNHSPSLTASVLAFGACRLRDEGKTPQEIATWALDACNFVHGYFTLDSLKWLAAGGRIPKAAASVSAVLNVKPNLTYDLDGSLTLMGVSRGRKKALKAVADQMDVAYEYDATLPLGIVSADAEADADALEEQVRAYFDKHGLACPPIMRFTLDPTVGAHVGPGMVALSFWGKDRRTMGAGRGKR